MSYTRKRIGICIGTAVAMVASLLVAVTASMPASAAPIPYPYQNPGTDLVASYDIPFAASDVQAFATNVMAPFYGTTSVNGDVTAMMSAAYSWAMSIGMAPTSITGGPVPTQPPLEARQATSVKIVPTSTTTSTCTSTTPKQTMASLADQAGAAMAGFASGVAAYCAAAFLIGMKGAYGLPFNTKYATFQEQRKGLMVGTKFAGFAMFNLAFLTVSYVRLGVQLKGAIWASIIAYCILDGFLGASVDFLAAWFSSLGGSFTTYLSSTALNWAHSIKTWFTGPFDDPAIELASFVQGALTYATQAALEQAELLAIDPGVFAMDVGGFVHNSNVLVDGQAVCFTSANPNPGPGTRVLIDICRGQADQYWQGYNHSGCRGADWRSCGDGKFTVMNRGLCLAPFNESSPSSPQDVILAWCDGNTAQQWGNSVGGLYGGLENAAAHLCVDVPLLSLGNYLDDATCQIKFGGDMIDREAWHGFDAFNTIVHPTRTALRILPFGDSITEGVNSSDDTGYRCYLENNLANAGYTYDMVGSLRNGTTCGDVDHEGHSGWLISQLQSIERCTIAAYQPNVVLLDIGTNDIGRGGAPAPAASALESLVNSIFNDDPGVTILVAGLIPTPDATVAANMRTFDLTIHDWINQQQAAGKRALYVDMSNVALGDGLHPSNAGYSQMAANWKQVIDGVGTMIQPANAPKNGCGDSSSFTPNWEAKGTIALGPPTNATVTSSGPGSLSLSGYKSAYYDMNGDGKDDFVAMGADGSLTVWLNTGQSSSGSVTWQSMGKITGGVGVNSEHVRIADVNGDGKADYLKLGDNGSVTLYPNNGPGCGVWCWGSSSTIALGVGATYSQVQFADLNNDKRADYLVVTNSFTIWGQVDAWINGGPACNWCWTAKANLAGGGSEKNPVFPDLNADGQADYVDVHSDNSAGAWLNPGLANLSNGGGWVNQGTIALGVGVSGSLVQFGDINGDGKDDYLVVNQTTGATQEWENQQPTSGATSGWKWNGRGSITSAAPTYSYQIRFAHFNSSNEAADYLVVNANSSVNIYYNGLAGCGGWCWTGPSSLALGVGVPGSEIQFADLNGDGIADYLDVSPTDGSVRAWQNGGGATWNPLGTIALGVGSPGDKIRFADMNADGKADYLRVNDNGSVDMWLNGGAGCGGWCWNGIGSIALGVGAPGSQIRFADLNGDKLADYITLGDDGRASAWLNPGLAGLYNGGPGWKGVGGIATGVGKPGSWVQWTDLTGDGKADYAVTDPTTGATSLWVNHG